MKPQYYTAEGLQSNQYLEATRCITNKQMFCIGYTDGQPDHSLKRWYNKDILTRLYPSTKT